MQLRSSPFALSSSSGVRAVRVSLSAQSSLCVVALASWKRRSKKLSKKKLKKNGTMKSIPCARFDAVPGGLLLLSRSLLQHSSPHKIVIPPLSTFAADSAGSSTVSSSSSLSPDKSEYEQNRRVSSAVATFLSAESAAELQRAQQLDAFREGNDEMLEKVWRDSKSHLRKQQKLVDEYGVEGAVRETLQPSTTSFREQLRQRPLDRAILQEIYLGLHGRRIERKLKRGVSWEHWITKGDGTAPVFNTSSKAQQTFAFGGNIQQVRCATHPQHFPVLLSHAPASEASATTGGLGKRDRSVKKHQKQLQHRSPPKSTSRLHPRHKLLPEVAFIGRTSSGKSSLINAIVNAMITPYGHLRGTTNSLRFYNVANRLMLVDCPGYGYYDAVCTPAIDAENALRAMRAYLKACAAPGAVQKMQQHRRSGRSVAGPHKLPSGKSGGPGDREANGAEAAGDEGDNDHHRDDTESLQLYQPRNVKRVFLCASSQGLQHLDYAYCDLLEAYHVPFAVVLTKTDAAPIRFLARLTDYTRSQLVRYTQCKEIMLTSSLRIAGIDKMQELLGSFAVADDPLHGATADFSSIV
ncbi:hypothetical protein, conserved [Leishmania tarentolae]|uniref:G domain-containing protein n=1 Tax=Leishmania tarentolae TaxID=5689 RepID=A0A640KI82_LEITA|nr:hypothetical protein, conserved [Leishmania tarentolae]